MQLRDTVLSFLFLSLSAHAQQDCTSALAIDTGTHVVPGIDGDEVPVLRCAANDQGPASHSVWYSYEAANDTFLLITTDVAGEPQVDTRFHVYSGTCDELVCVVGNDNGGLNGTSRASFEATAGTTYYIVWDDRWSSDAFSFSLEQISYWVANTERYMSFTSSFMNLGGAPLAVVDMDNDGLDDGVSASQSLVHINYQLAGGGFDPVGLPTDYATFPPSWSLCAGDLDGNGYKDLLYGGGYGVSFMFASDDGQAFSHRSTNEYVFSQRSNMIDINNDGHLDAFVCHDVAPNVFYLNDGTGQLSFNQGGLGYSCGNYGSIWVDHDNDGDMDLYVAKCGCDANDLLMRNDGDGQFTQIAGPLGAFDYHQSWSSAWGDFDNDGDMDVLVGSSSGTIHHLVRNDGGGVFTDITAGSGLDTFWGQGIEWVTHDFDNDGRLDILGGGSLLKNLGDMRFAWNTGSPGHGAVGDLNNDGSLDVFGYGGLQLGVPNGGHWVRIALHGTVSNTDGIGARVTVESALGTQIREVRSGDGFRYMSSLMPHFGLGPDEQITRITVRWPSGIVQEVEAQEVDQVIHLTEPLNTGVAEVGAATVRAYPNPAGDQLWFSGVDTGLPALVRLVDMTGRVVGERRLVNGGVDVRDLAPGMYGARITLAGGTQDIRFQKR